MITSIEEVRENKLTWPDNKPRCGKRVASQFDTGLDVALRQIRDEMVRHDARDYIISRNQLRTFAGDPGVAVWWTARVTPVAGPNLRVLACDKFIEMRDNARAIARTLFAMRGLERWGAYTIEQATEGARIALPPPRSEAVSDWWITLGVQREWPLDAIQALYRQKAEKAHPDRGGTVEAFQALTAAMDACKKEKRA